MENIIGSYFIGGGGGGLESDKESRGLWGTWGYISRDHPSISPVRVGGRDERSQGVELRGHQNITLATCTCSIPLRNGVGGVGYGWGHGIWGHSLSDCDPSWGWGGGVGVSKGLSGIQLSNDVTS